MAFLLLNHPLTQDQWTEARAMVREQHQGMDNAHTPWVLGAGANWQQMSLSPAEMDFINSRKFTREEICTIFQVPPPMIGILEKATYQNIETARKILWQDSIVPLLEDIKDCFNLSLTPEFGQDIELSYDLGNVEALQETTGDKITQAKDLFAMGVPFNMINQKLELGFDNIDGGDTGFLPNSLVPAEEMANKTLPPPIDPNKQPLPPNNQDPNAKPPPNAQTDPPQPDKVPPKTIGALLTKEQKANATKGINLKTEQQKDYYTEQVHQQRAKWITNLTRKSAQLFEAEGTAVAKAVKTGDWKKAIDSHKEQWEKFYQASYQAIAVDIGKNTFDNLQKAYTPRYFKAEGDFFDPYDEIITAYIVELAGTKVTWVSDWTKQIIGAMVKENNDNNGTMDDLAKMIKDQYKEFSRYRSYRIARTETQNALGFAQYQAGHQAQEKLGVAIVGEWWTSLDDRVRKSHEELHGTRAKLGQPFGNGLTFAGQYENDLGGHNNINCRCVILHHLEGEDL